MGQMTHTTQTTIATTNNIHISDTEKRIIEFSVLVHQHTSSDIPNSIAIAQALLESDLGRSDVALRTNNLFGIKSGKNYRQYESVLESIIDHSRFLSHYYPLALGKNWQHWTTWCKGYGGAGYWAHVKKYIEIHRLWRFDSPYRFSWKA